VKLIDWFRDRALRKVVKFGLPIALGKFGASLAGLVTLALLAHQLGPGPLGVIAVIRATVSTLEQYANFNTWQVIIKYGTEAIAREKPSDVERLIKLSLLIDLATAALATLLVIGIAFVIPGTFGWTSHEAFMCAVYGVTVLTRVAGTSDGIFRLCDAYRPQAIATIFSAGFATLSVAVAVAMDAGFDGCIVALIVGEVVGNIVLTAVTFWVAKKNGYGNWPSARLRGVRTAFPGIFHFLVSTNAQLTVKKTQADFDTFVVGAMLGKIPSGLFRVVKQLGTIPGRVFMPFEIVLFTELARASSVHDYRGFRRFLRRSVAIFGGGSLVIWALAAVAAEPILRLVAGAEFVPAAASFRWYLLAMALNVANAPTLRAMIALGRPGTLFFFELATLALLVGTGIAATALWGIAGVSAAVAFVKFIQMIWSILLIRNVLRAREAEHAASELAAPANNRQAP
jgi:O-antigen/teichoic acid export membrane protein